MDPPDGVQFGPNTCYLNSVYQMLRAVSARHPHTQRHIMDRFRQWKSPFERARQEDAHECLMSIYDQLMPDQNDVASPRHGIIRSVVECPTTNESSVVDEPFWIISLDLHATLREALKAFRRIERITGENVWLSPKSTTNRMSPLYTTKRLDIGKWPEGILYIHMKRFCWPSRTKDTREVSVPMRILRDTLRLVAVIVHHGSGINGGHYVCCVQYPDGHWYLCNDETVTEITTADVQSTYIPHAYMVAYA